MNNFLAELNHVVNLSKPKLIFCSDKTIEKIISTLPKFPYVTRVVHMGTKKIKNRIVINMNEIIIGNIDLLMFFVLRIISTLLRWWYRSNRRGIWTSRRRPRWSYSHNFVFIWDYRLTKRCHGDPQEYDMFHGNRRVSFIFVDKETRLNPYILELSSRNYWTIPWFASL